MGLAHSKDCLNNIASHCEFQKSVFMRSANDPIILTHPSKLGHESVQSRLT